MHSYFALPAVMSDEVGDDIVTTYGRGVQVHPCLKVLAMGWSHSVYVTQSVHENILDTRTVRCLPGDRIKRGADLTLRDGRVLHAVYIDDVVFIGLDPDRVAATLDEYLEVLGLLKLPAKPAKVIRPSTDGVEGLGFVIHGTEHTVGVSAVKRQKLVDSTAKLLQQRFATGRQVARCVGQWTWCMLANRPALSVFNAVYRFINVAGEQSYSIWRSVRRELWTAMRLAPLLVTSLSVGWFHSVVTCDASLTGQVCALLIMTQLL